MLLLGYRHSSTPVMPVIGQPLAVQSKVTLEEMQKLVLTVFKCVDPEHKYV